MQRDGSSSEDQDPNDIPIISLRAFIRDFTFGSAAGMVSEVFEYPFDLAKVRLQAQLLTTSSTNGGAPLPFTGPMDCLKQTWKEEGVKGLYRGFTVPLVGAMAETAALFLAYGSFQNIIRVYSPPSIRSAEQGQQLSITQLGIAAAAAGFATSFVVTPIELIKCRMQVQMMSLHTNQPPIPATSLVPLPVNSVVAAATLPVDKLLPPPGSPSPPSSSSSHNKLSQKPLTHTLKRNFFTDIRNSQPPGPLQITQSIIKAHGLKGLWLGHSATILRDTGMTVSWFVVKEYTALRMRDHRLSGLSEDERVKEKEKGWTMWESGISGSFSGAFCVLALYPVDTVKSAIQADVEIAGGREKKKKGAPKTPLTFWNVTKMMYRTHGIRGLYAGCGMTVARAVPSSGIVFIVYDQLGAMFP